jgi:hypothetical protein
MHRLVRIPGPTRLVTCSRKKERGLVQVEYGWGKGVGGGAKDARRLVFCWNGYHFMRVTHGNAKGYQTGLCAQPAGTLPDETRMVATWMHPI